jgi:hypothetical protein
MLNKKITACETVLSLLVWWGQVMNFGVRPAKFGAESDRKRTVYYLEM